MKADVNNIGLHSHPLSLQFQTHENFSRISLYVSLVLEIPDGFHHLRLAVSRPLHMTKLIVFVNFNSVRLLGKATKRGRLHP